MPSINFLGQGDMVFKFSEPQYVSNVGNFSHFLMHGSYKGVCSPPEIAPKEIHCNGSCGRVAHVAHVVNSA